MTDDSGTTARRIVMYEAEVEVWSIDVAPGDHEVTIDYPMKPGQRYEIVTHYEGAICRQQVTYCPAPTTRKPAPPDH